MQQDLSNKRIIINCKNCSTKLRVPLFLRSRITITCPKCNYRFKFNYRKHNLQTRFKSTVLNSLLCLLIFLVIASPVYGLYLANNQSQLLLDVNEARVSRYKDGIEASITNTRDRYLKIIKEINAEELRITASENYEKIWQERNNYNTKYALSEREKAQLRMISLARNSDGNVASIVKNITQMASPKNSEVYVDKIYSGNFVVYVNFHMSDLTKGEKGTRTKHKTIKSLRGEAIRLVSKVTNDVYIACKGLDLDEIYIGCKHRVTTTYGNGRDGPEEDMIIFKVKIVKKDVKELVHNPFLDIYSVEKHIRTVEDNFPNLRITNT